MANVFDPVRTHAETAPDSVALRSERGEWTYRQLHRLASRYAGALAAAGLSPGDRVLLAAPSVPEFVVAYLGIQAAGCVAVPVNTMSTRAEVEYFLTDAGCALAIAWHELGPAVADAAQHTRTPFWSLPPGAQTAAEPAARVDRDRTDTAAILYTSGTTGRPKGAQLTVGNLLAGGEIGAACSRGTAADRTGTGLPLFHVFGQAAVMMSCFTSGGSLSLLARFDPVAMLELLRRDRLTIMAGVPTMWNAMLRAADAADPADFEQLRVAISGGASLPGDIAREFQKTFGCTILEGYGLTETTGFGTFNDLDRGAKIGYTGRAVPRTRVDVRDHDSRPCPPGQVGEVFVQGETVMKGYWRRPEATAEVLSPDGWLRTGDLGGFDVDGDLRIVDRVKDLIIRGGYNVYPGEVEEVLYEHPEIVEAAVVGVPDDHYGEEVAAVIVTAPDSSLDAEAVSRWSRERLSAYKIPRIIGFADALPKGATGKILKRAIDRDALRR
ncbi:AMP-binding protein [Nocardia cyriacigeorgica]|uniref:AMP-binding protein n=1 Tax=Nocardia cyriacigeorgica TaxID=135487 RepID=UPI0018941D20|nr:AMP-binding protein [Nocardia cyriacigeorgica]MBF6457090.1 AMP-binding protein [Nocardia cyriacigeorgica]MBF6480771.1 AMP-binding protein [Nocardia cyriacigeorgica]MBF6554249.1 AMP-binding protein [Nocardia cyriacigeorgica]